jgi:hypothetical protein
MTLKSNIIIRIRSLIAKLPGDKKQFMGDHI